LEEQLNQPGTRASDYLRLHENLWVQSSEAFIPKKYVQRAMTFYEQSALTWREHPYRTYDICVGVDAAPKRDSTAVVGVAADPETGHTILMFDKIWTPVEGEDFDFEVTVENFLLQVYNMFRIVSIRHDPAHLHQTMVRLRRKNLPIEEFSQTDGNMIPASQTLFDSLKNGTLEMYHSQGMQDHLLAAVADVKTRGYRITKKNKRSKPVDAAVALAIANYEAINRSAGAMRDPLIIQSAFPDRTAWKDKMPGDDLLPPELRG
jgi:phage terminase large subunit-like protein